MKAEEEAKLSQQREEEEKEQTKSAAAKDLQEEQILDEIEIKLEIVLDPNEWVLLGFYWIGAELLN